MLREKLIICFCFATGLLHAQDVITKISGEEIKAKVMEVGINEIKYHRFDNLTGPVYTMQKSDVLMIVYEDGAKDVFDKPQSRTQTAMAPQIQPPTVASASAREVPLAEAKKGDIVTINGQKAIVFQTFGGGHGKAMAIKAMRGVKDAWCKTGAVSNLHTTDKENGKANTEEVFRFATEKGLNISDFPAAAWCKSLGEGWYIPSIKELETFVNWWLGNDVELNWDDESADDAQSPMLSGTPFSKQINSRLLEADGIPFINGAFTSTENEKGKLSVFWFNEHKGYWQFSTVAKTGVGTMYLGRAFFEF